MTLKSFSFWLRLLLFSKMWLFGIRFNSLINLFPLPIFKLNQIFRNQAFHPTACIVKDTDGYFPHKTFGTPSAKIAMFWRDSIKSAKILLFWKTSHSSSNEWNTSRRGPFADSQGNPNEPTLEVLLLTLMTSLPEIITELWLTINMIDFWHKMKHDG